MVFLVILSVLICHTFYFFVMKDEKCRFVLENLHTALLSHSSMTFFLKPDYRPVLFFGM